MAADCVVDTSVLQKANAPLSTQPRARSLFRRRLTLLERISRRELSVLISRQLIAEYDRQIREPRNEYIRAFLELVTDPSKSIFNWHTPWSGDRDNARKCRFPREDDHVLRTAICGGPSVIFTEEGRMLRADACIYHNFRVHIQEPPVSA